MRSAFHKELEKIKQSRKSGSSADDIYIPTFSYYELLLFSANQEESQNTISNDSSYTEECEAETEKVKNR